MATQQFNTDIDVNGEVKGTSLDINGNADISGDLTGVDTLTATTLSVTNYGLASGDIPNNAANTSGSSGSTTGNAATVTNGVYTTGDQTIGGNKTFSNNLTVNGTTILDSLQLEATGDYITLYGGNSTQHSITSRQLAGGTGDDLRFNTYGSYIINLDSNNNQSSAANSSFYITKHGGADGDASGNLLFDIDGENGDATFTGDVTGVGTLTATTLDVTNYGLASGDIPNNAADTSGSAATLTTARAINGVDFDGSADITVTAAAGTLSGTILNSTVVTSSLTSVGIIGSGSWRAGEIGTTYTQAKVSSIVAGDGIDVSGATGDVTVTAETASDSNPGVVELATTGEATTGTDTGRAVTPAGVAAVHATAQSGKSYRIVNCSFRADIGTTKYYLPLKSQDEQTVLTREENQEVAVCDGRLVSLTWRAENFNTHAGDATVTFGVETNTVGSSYSGGYSVIETEAVTVNNADDNHLWHVVFDTAKHWDSTDMFTISMQSDTDITGSNERIFITLVIEDDWSTYLAGATREIDTTP